MSTERGEGVENPKEARGRSKLPLHLVPPAASRDMARALERGAAKYGAWNWRRAGVYLTTYVAAMRRHLDAIMEGEDIDPESGVPHVGHVLAGAAILADAAEHEMLNDDRPPSLHAGFNIYDLLDDLERGEVGAPSSSPEFDADAFRAALRDPFGRGGIDREKAATRDDMNDAAAIAFGEHAIYADKATRAPAEDGDQAARDVAAQEDPVVAEGPSPFSGLHQRVHRSGRISYPGFARGRRAPSMDEHRSSYTGDPTRGPGSEDSDRKHTRSELEAMHGPTSGDIHAMVAFDQLREEGKL